MVNRNLTPRPLAGHRLRRNPSTWSPYAIAIALIGCATALGFIWASMPDPRNLALLFFGAILITGVWLGMRPALFAAALAFFAYNFFLVEPRFSFHFAPADLLALAIFFVAAVLVGGLAGRLSDRARDATNRLRDLTVLFEASRDLSAAIEPNDAAKRVVDHLERAGCRVAIWIQSGSGLRLAAASPSKQEAAQALSTRAVKFLASSWVDEVNGGDLLLRLETGERTLGAAALWPLEDQSRILPDLRWIEALLELGAVAIDRARLIAEVAEANIVAEKEGLRTALLSSLSHDLRTPIATILASATGLQEHDAQFDRATRREMLDTIQEETERLNRYVSNLLEMTRLESGALQLRRALIDPDEAMASALERIERRLKSRRVLRTFRTRRLRIDVDPVLMEQALVNVVENAVAHAPAGSTILVSTESIGDQILIAVEDEGPGIPAADLERVFDRFFHGRSDRRLASGVGLGLSVTRGLIESFSGHVRAVSPAAGGRGARFEILLPAHPALETGE